MKPVDTEVALNPTAPSTPRPRGSLRQRDSFLAALVLALTTAVPASGQSSPEPISLDKLLEISSVVGGETPRWSPDGSRILFSSGLMGGLVTVSVNGGFPVRVPVRTGGAGHFLARQQPRWSPNGEWISFISDKGGKAELWLFSLRTGEERRLTDLGGRINAYDWSPDGHAIALSGNRLGNYDIWVVGVPDGRVRRLTFDERYEVFPSWLPEGGRLLYVRLDETWVDHEVLEIAATGGEPRLVVRDTDFFDYQAGAKFGHALPSPAGNRVLFRSHRSGWINYWVVSRSGGAARPIAPEDADQSHARWSPDGSRIAYISNHDGTHDLRLVAADGGESRVIVTPDGMGSVRAPEWSPDGMWLSYTLETPTQPKDLYVVRVHGGESRRLTRSLPEGGLAERLVEPRKVRYPSTDGFQISAYLYAPPGAEAAGPRYPGILWIHGGPTGQFDDDFQQHVQFFVQRGYVLLLPNIRGSSGYGKSFEDANNGCWGRCDLEDVRAGVEFLHRLPYVNPEATGITGTSYGGCMSMAAISFAPDLFQAAVPLSGYGDWFHTYEEQELRHIKLLNYELGTPEENPEVYRNSSPYYWIDDVKTPVFLAHGVGRLPRSDASAHFARALEKHYKVFRYETYPNENYYIYGRENRARLLRDMLEFFQRYLGDPSSGSGTASMQGGASR